MRAPSSCAPRGGSSRPSSFARWTSRATVSAHDVRHHAAGGEDAPRAVAVPGEVAEPADHVFLDERRGHAGEPEVDALVHPRGERLPDDRHGERRGREVAERTGMLRGEQVRRQSLVELGQHVRGRDAARGRRSGSARRAVVGGPQLGVEVGRGRPLHRPFVEPVERFGPRSLAERLERRRALAPGRGRRSARARDASRSARTRADASSGRSSAPAGARFSRGDGRARPGRSRRSSTSEATASTIQVSHPSTGGRRSRETGRRPQERSDVEQACGDQVDAGVDADVAPRAGRRAPEERSGPHQHERHRDRDQHPREEVRQRRPEPIRVERLARHDVDQREEPQDRDEHALRDQDRADRAADPFIPGNRHE